MTNSGDAAEQIVRMSLEGVEVAAKITGSAAKEIATFLVAALKSNSTTLKPKGKARMTSMLKSGKPLEIFSVKDSDLQKFMRGAKQYGIVYCVLRNKKHDKDGMCDILVKADDAPKISRVIERFKFATVDKAKIESEIVKTKAEKAQETGAEPAAPDKNDTEKLLDDFLGTDEGKTEPDKPDVSKTTPKKESPTNPETAKTAKTPPSAPTSESRSKSAGGTSSKPSVKEEIREITAELKSKREADAPKRDERQTDTPRGNSSTTHKQPQTGGKSKSKKSKER
ncbi:hypothetical protein FACS18947_6850 [Bacteroidia bacterium]|nr:hypothetical protein FACS18947_6850 [Bacteroidia bacterium]